MRRAFLSFVLLASVAQATSLKMVFPGVVSQNAAGGYAPTFTANTLYCWTVPAPYTLSGATKMAAYFFTGTGAKTVSFGIYENDDAGALKASISGADTAGLLSASGLASTDYVGGTLYRVCACASSTAAVGYLMLQQSTTCCQDVNVTSLMQAFHGSYVGTAASTCTPSTAALPPSTGAITADATMPERGKPRMPIVFVQQ